MRTKRVKRKGRVEIRKGHVGTQWPFQYFVTIRRFVDFRGRD